MNEQTTQQQTCVCQEVMNLVRKLGPSDAVMQHFRSARIEVLKGIRQALDERIENLGKTQSHGTKVVVE